MATRDNHILGCIIKPVAIRQKQEILILYSALVRLHLAYCTPVGASQYRSDTDILEHVNWKATKIVRGLLQDIRGDQLRELGLFSLKQTTLREHFIADDNFLR